MSLKSDCEELYRCLFDSVNILRRNFIRAGFLLNKIHKERSYEYALRNDKRWFCYADSIVKNPFEQFCKEYLGLSDSTVYGLISVYRRFGSEDGEILPAYKDYNYSQLLEMNTLPDDALSNVNASMTVKQIKKLKPKEVKAEDEKQIEEKKTVFVQKTVFSNMNDKKEEFKRYCKYYFEQRGANLIIDGQRIGGQAFGSALFDYLEKKG